MPGNSPRQPETSAVPRPETTILGAGQEKLRERISLTAKVHNYILKFAVIYLIILILVNPNSQV